MRNGNKNKGERKKSPSLTVPVFVHVQGVLPDLVAKEKSLHLKRVDSLFKRFQKVGGDNLSLL